MLSQILFIPIVHYSFVSPPFSSLTDKVAPLSKMQFCFSSTFLSLGSGDKMKMKKKR